MDEKEFGIKYKVIKVDEAKYLLIPMCLCCGVSDAFEYTTDSGEIYKIANSIKDLNNEYVMDKVFTLDELHDFEHEFAPFAPNNFFETFKNILIYIDADPKNDILKKNEIDLTKFIERQYDLTYLMDRKGPVVALNVDAFNELRNASSLNEVYLLLEKYKANVEAFRELFRKKGVTKINMERGKVTSYETNKKVENVVDEPFDLKDASPSLFVPSPKTVQEKENPKDFSYNGLCDYIKERVFGHDSEIDTIAKILYLNKTAKVEDGVESVIINGPSGTGKTETIKAAASYLNVPYMEINAANIVPQGIKGTSIEDVLSNLYIRSNYNQEVAERGLVFLDEFDKLNDNDLEIKGSVKDILLTFTQGGSFPIDNDFFSLSFDTSMLSKVFAGVFDKIRHEKRVIGFGNERSQAQTEEKELDLREKLIKEEYFTQEELSRINTIITFGDLDRETKKRILLYSKLSELMKKKNRYMRDYGIDIIAEDSYIEAVLDEIKKNNEGMRVVNNIVKGSMNEAEKDILRHSGKGYKRLVLTKKTVSNPREYDIS